MKVLLLSTYELGHQPFGLASPAAWLRRAGHEVVCADLSVSTFPSAAARDAALIAFYLPMHTATRLALPVIEKVRTLNPAAHLAGFGLYAPLNAVLLKKLGVESAFGGEFEPALVALADRLASGGPPQPAASTISLERLTFLTPDRTGLPGLGRYARLRVAGERRVTGYVEASRGCKHLCRHCPIVPVYKGTFRVVQADVVMEDIRRQVKAGARHITFGDPDFWNGPAHARLLVESLHAEFPELTYDVTIKIEHLLRHRDMLPGLRETGCLFVTSAVESVDDLVLERLAKGHTRGNFIEAAHLFRNLGLVLNPTFIPFTPWTTWDGYRDLLAVLVELDLVENTSPVQLALRLLIPASSRLLELEDVRQRITEYSERSLIWRWTHPDPAIDRLSSELLNLVAAGQKAGLTRTEIFRKIWERVHEGRPPENFDLMPRATVPYLDEPWYC